MLLEKWRPFGSYDPFDTLWDIQKEMNKLFDEGKSKSKRGELASAVWSPVVDVKEDKNAYHINAELPGMNQKDIEVKVEDNVLTIRGERKFEDEEKKDNYHRVERSYGSFARSFTLPKTAALDRIKASYKDGILKLNIPKREESKPKQITVEVDGK